jgi:Asp-tRNA(Asn)/Glu-tRNA(Gln) amidotransferase B subunit
MGFFVGEAMKLTKGKGNPKEINRLVSALLSENI